MTASVRDRRVLGAIRFIDHPTGMPVRAALEVRAEGAHLRRNGGGDWVVWRAEGLASHQHAFESAPTTPSEGSIALTGEVRDATGRYLPRRFTFRLPRVPGGTHDLFEPVRVHLSPSPAFPLTGNWATVRVRVLWAAGAGLPEVPIEGALVRLESTELGGVRCASLTSREGEALVVATGIPLFSPGSGDEAVLEPAVSHDVRVVFDPAATDDATGRRSVVADPDDLWTRVASLRWQSLALPLAPGEQQVRAVTFSRS